MSKNKKILIVFLLILTGVVGGLSVYFTYQLQQSQAPTDTHAAGFGDTATTNNFGNVESAFAAVTCDQILNDVKDIADFKDVDLKITTNSPQTLMPKDCIYDFGNGKKMYFYLHTYNKDSKIDASQDALFTRVNGQTITTKIDQGKVGGNIFYFFGTDAQYKDSCRNNLFHPQNDFEYATFVYQGFGDCSKLSADNKSISTKVATEIDNVMVGFSTPF